MKKYIGTETLIDKLAEKKKISRKDAEVILKDVTDVLKESLLDSKFNGVQFMDFITLERVVRASRLGRNPRTKEEINIPAKNSIKARVGKAFGLKLNI